MSPSWGDEKEKGPWMTAEGVWRGETPLNETCTLAIPVPDMYTWPSSSNKKFHPNIIVTQLKLATKGRVKASVECVRFPASVKDCIPGVPDGGSRGHCEFDLKPVEIDVSSGTPDVLIGDSRIKKWKKNHTGVASRNLVDIKLGDMVRMSFRCPERRKRGESASTGSPVVLVTIECPDGAWCMLKSVKLDIYGRPKVALKHWRE